MYIIISREKAYYRSSISALQECIRVYVTAEAPVNNYSCNFDLGFIKLIKEIKG